MITTRKENKNKNNFKMITENFQNWVVSDETLVESETDSTILGGLDRISVENLAKYIGSGPRGGQFLNDAARRVNAALIPIYNKNIKDMNLSGGPDSGSKKLYNARFALTQMINNKKLNGGILIGRRVGPRLKRETAGLVRQMAAGNLQAYLKFKDKMVQILKQDAQYSLSGIVKRRGITNIYMLDTEQARRSRDGEYNTWVKGIHSQITSIIDYSVRAALDAQEKIQRKEAKKPETRQSGDDGRPALVQQPTSRLDNMLATLTSDGNPNTDEDMARRIIMNAGNGGQEDFQALLRTLQQSGFTPSDIQFLINAAKKANPGMSVLPDESEFSKKPTPGAATTASTSTTATGSATATGGASATSTPSTTRRPGAGSTRRRRTGGTSSSSRYNATKGSRQAALIRALNRAGVVLQEQDNSKKQTATSFPVRRKSKDEELPDGLLDASGNPEQAPSNVSPPPSGKKITLKALQQALLFLGYKLPKFGADGEYGRETHDAIVQFQNDNLDAVGKFGSDGLIGSDTFKVLKRKVAEKKASPTSPKAAAAKTSSLAKAASSSLKTSRSSALTFIKSVNAWVNKTAKNNSYIDTLKRFIAQNKEASGARVTLKNSTKFWGAMLAGDDNALKKIIPRQKHDLFFNREKLNFDPKKVDKDSPGLLKLYRKHKTFLDLRLKAIGDLDDDQSPRQIYKRMKDKSKLDYSKFGRDLPKPPPQKKPRLQIENKLSASGYFRYVVTYYLRAGGGFEHGPSRRDTKPIKRMTDQNNRPNFQAVRFDQTIKFIGNSLDKQKFRKSYIKFLNKFGLPGVTMKFKKGGRNSAAISKRAEDLDSMIRKKYNITREELSQALYSEDGK